MIGRPGRLKKKLNKHGSIPEWEGVGDCQMA